VFITRLAQGLYLWWGILDLGPGKAMHFMKIGGLFFHSSWRSLIRLNGGLRWIRFKSLRVFSRGSEGRK